MQRTCSNLNIDDCKSVNKVHYCYCNRPLCNGENAESIIEKLGDVNDEEEDIDDNVEDASGSDEDDEDFNYRSTSQKIDSSETSTHGGTAQDYNIVSLSVSTTAQSTINTAVNSNLSRNLLISLTLAHLIIVYHQN